MVTRNRAEYFDHSKKWNNHVVANIAFYSTIEDLNCDFEIEYSILHSCKLAYVIIIFHVQKKECEVQLQSIYNRLYSSTRIPEHDLPPSNNITRQ